MTGTGTLAAISERVTAYPTGHAAVGVMLNPVSAVDAKRAHLQRKLQYCKLIDEMLEEHLG